MFNFGIIKVTIIYMVSIVIMYNIPYSLNHGMWQICILCAFVLGILFKKSSLPVYLLICSIVVCQFLSIKPKHKEYYGAYCKVQKVSEKSYGTRLFCSCNSQGNRFKSLVYYTGEIHKLRKGEVYFINTTFKLHKNNRLPHEFSYSHYLNKQGVYYSTQNLNSTYFQKIKSTDLINGYHSTVVEYIDGVLTLYFSEDKVSIIKALCFGIKDNLTKETYAYYKKTGLMHIIAVSGLHVGIIQFMLLFVFGLLFGKSARAVLIQQFVVVLLLIIFSWLCGFSLSIVRSVLMFTILYYSMLSKRIINPIHALFLSAFIMLLYNPLQLFDLGFQFSYLATFGLVLSGKYILNLVIGIRLKFLRWIVQISLISLVTQIFLSPLIFYYFGELPIWFLVYNIPGFIFVSVLLVLMMVFFLVQSLSPQFADYLQVLIDWLITKFEELLKVIDYTDVVYLKFQLSSVYEVISYCSILVLMAYIILKYKWRLIKFLGGILILFLMFIGTTEYWLRKRSEVIVWNTNYEQVVTIKNIDTIYIYTPFEYSISDRIIQYAKSSQSKLSTRILIKEEFGGYSNLYKIKDGKSDTIVCLVNRMNTELNAYFDANYKHSFTQFLMFKDGVEKFNNLKYNFEPLKYGVTKLNDTYTVFFYP